MRLALIASLVSPIREPQRGGAQSFLADLAVGLTRRGHEVDVFAASGSAIHGVQVVDIGIDASTLHEFLYRAGSSPPSDSTPFVTAYKRVFEAVAERSYDVVHNHAFDAPAITCSLDSASPVVHTLHLPPEGSVVRAVRDALRTTSPPLIATVSASQVEVWRRFIDVDVVLPVGVVTAQIPWSATPGAGAVFAGRFSPEKGAVDAIAIARRARMSIDLYGDAYDDGYAEREIYPAGGHAGVTVHRAVPRAVLWKVIAGAAALLCPAKWDEPFGLIAAEAQACGTPVIAYRAGALQEVVLDEVTGYLVARDDIDGASAALARIDSIDRTGCRRHAEEHLDIDAVLDAHERVYHGLVRSTLATAHG